MNDREVFRRNLNHYLSVSGKMQKDLAEYVGAKTTTVSGWTRGISYPRADAMEKIALFFGISTSQLVGSEADGVQFADDELRLLTAYRHASDEIRDAALAILEDSAARNRKTPANGEIAM